jgi:hypothetical protein
MELSRSDIHPVRRIVGGANDGRTYVGLLFPRNVFVPERNATQVDYWYCVYEETSAFPDAFPVYGHDVHLTEDMALECLWRLLAAELAGRHEGSER